jgi:hypothetical protein
MSKQINMVSLDQLVNENHQYRKFKELFDFEAVEKELVAVEKYNNYKGYGILVLSHVLKIEVNFDNLWEIIKGKSDKNRSKINKIFQES